MKKEETKAKPFIKWVGGKRQLLPVILERIPKDINTYYEPFIGGGALMYNIKSKAKKASDINEELINTYNTIKNNYKGLAIELAKHNNDEESFYKVRNWDKEEDYKTKYSEVERAARFIFLNKTAFNGMYRENSKGYYNVPFGRMVNPTILDESNLKLCNDFFQDIEFNTYSFHQILEEAVPGDFIYLDPPYVPLSATSSFTSYSKDNFTLQMHLDLKEFCDKLTEKGINFMLSNSSAQFVVDLYKDYTVELIDARRSINSKGDSRGNVKEVLVRNY